ncbi:MAG: NAD(P)H-hydrate dehydratase [Coriobacteriia bacterium]|nr:NAD(P)H-hydrate dehydratase [Coriobacteriia bacterium]
MFRTLTAAQTRAVEEEAVSAGVSLASLMRSAGLQVARVVAEKAACGDVVVLAGPGNNGGDGWVAARDLKAAGRSVKVLSVRNPGELSGIAAEAARDAIASGVQWRVPFGSPAPDELAEAAVIVDALLGTGVSGAPRAPIGAWVDAANAGNAFVVAVDVPTGVDADSGAVPGGAMRADCTVTFAAPKLGLLTYPGAGYVGEMVVADVGTGLLVPVPGVAEVWDSADYAALLPVPALGAHKNSRGRVLVVAGSLAYPGAAILAAKGAMRSGAGYVRLAVPRSVVPIAQCHLLAVPVVGLPEGTDGALSAEAAEEVLSLAENADAVVLGPGLTVAPGAVAAVREVVLRLKVPVVLDADALNALANGTDLVRGLVGPVVMTPHPGELARLLKTSVERVQSDRLSSAGMLAGQMRAVVLKGAGTITSGADRQVINTSGTPALATAGTGDVLSGVIGALLAQGLGPLEAGALGAYLHGRAGEAAAEVLTPVCVTAEDVPGYLPVAVAGLLGAKNTRGKTIDTRALGGR